MAIKRIIGIAALGLLALVAPAARAAGLQPIGQFNHPTYVTSDPSDGERLFVVERSGTIEEVDRGAIRLFADLTGVVGCNGECSGERGLLSIAPAPEFESSGRFYVDFADDQSGTIHVAEMHAVGDTAPNTTFREVLSIPHPDANNHNGGQLQFGPEGNLFISTGDGGGANDQFHNAQSLTSLLGKILRINPRPNNNGAYSIPAGNPFAGAAAPFNTIWSYGLRNPFRFSFDRASGAMAIADVGQDAREEVDFAAPGGGGGVNYGWNCREGSLPGPPAQADPGCATPSSPFVEPIFDYPHLDPNDGSAHGCAIIGGYVVRDAGLPELAGRYLYGDLCTGELRSFAPGEARSSDRSENLTVSELNSFGEDACDRVYAVSGSGTVYRLAGGAPTVCPLVPSFTGIRAARRSVLKRKRARITVWVSPCAGRRGKQVSLYRGRRRLETKRLDLACSARFSPRILRRTTFRAKIGPFANFEGSTSRGLAIGIRHAGHGHHHKKKH
jgi:hypothetical protein